MPRVCFQHGTVKPFHRCELARVSRLLVSGVSVVKRWRGVPCWLQTVQCCTEYAHRSDAIVSRRFVSGQFLCRRHFSLLLLAALMYCVHLLCPCHLYIGVKSVRGYNLMVCLFSRSYFIFMCRIHSSSSVVRSVSV